MEQQTKLDNNSNIIEVHRDSYMYTIYAVVCLCVIAFAVYFLITKDLPPSMDKSFTSGVLCIMVFSGFEIYCLYILYTCKNRPVLTIKDDCVIYKPVFGNVTVYYKDVAYFIDADIPQGFSRSIAAIGVMYKKDLERYQSSAIKRAANSVSSFLLTGAKGTRVQFNVDNLTTSRMTLVSELNRRLDNYKLNNIENK